jgi:hypothetical protein
MTSHNGFTTMTNRTIVMNQRHSSLTHEVGSIDSNSITPINAAAVPKKPYSRTHHDASRSSGDDTITGTTSGMRRLCHRYALLHRSGTSVPFSAASEAANHAAPAS